MVTPWPCHQPRQLNYLNSSYYLACNNLRKLVVNGRKTPHHEVTKVLEETSSPVRLENLQHNGEKNFSWTEMVSHQIRTSFPRSISFHLLPSSHFVSVWKYSTLTLNKEPHVSKDNYKTKTEISFGE